MLSRPCSRGAQTILVRASLTESTGRRCRAQGGGYALAAPIVEGYDAAVAKGQLELALTLLAGYLAGDGAVDLVGEPVLAGYALKLEHLLKVL